MSAKNVSPRKRNNAPDVTVRHADERPKGVSQMFNRVRFSFGGVKINTPLFSAVNNRVNVVIVSFANLTLWN